MSKISPPRYWREAKYRYMLIGSRCLNCGKIYFPRRSICRVCRSRKMEDYKLSEKGIVESFTVIRRNPPLGFERNVPYIVGIVKLKDGVRVISQIVDCIPEEVWIGMPVELTFRRIREDGAEGIIEYGFKFKPTNQ